MITTIRLSKYYQLTIRAQITLRLLVELKIQRLLPYKSILLDSLNCNDLRSSLEIDAIEPCNLI